MTLCCFLGDEVSALGFRLAGVECHSPEPGELQGLLGDLLGRVELILMTADLAAMLPQGLLHRVQAAGRPLILPIADVRRQRESTDLAAEVRRQLGMAE
jgi:vacuolar-type H+-ATPase subunit F/Vma7